MNSYQNNQNLYEVIQSIGRLKRARLDDLDRIAEIESKLTLLLNSTHSMEEYKPQEEIQNPHKSTVANGRKLSEDELSNINGKIFSHSPDFRSAFCKGRNYYFTTAQAACVQILYEQYRNYTPEISGEYILTTIGYFSQRLSDLFKNSPAWGQLIIPGNTRGTYRLNISSNSALE